MKAHSSGYTCKGFFLMKLYDVGKPIVNLVLLRWDNPPLNWALPVSGLTWKKEVLVLFLFTQALSSTLVPLMVLD